MLRGGDKGKEKDLAELVDVLVDVLMGFLEKVTARHGVLARGGQSGVRATIESTIDLILSHLSP